MALEADLAALAGCAHAVLAPMGRTAIYLAIQAIIKPGQIVVLSPLTISDVVNMVICAGGVPRFVDVEPHTGHLDPDRLEAALVGDVGAVLLTHLHGLPARVDEIAALCARHGVPLIEDAAQALGAQAGGRPVGGFGAAGVFSFGLFKHITGLYGGAVVCNDAALAARLRLAQAGWWEASPLRLAARAVHGLGIDVLTRSAVVWPVVWRTVRFGQLHAARPTGRLSSTDRAPRLRLSLPKALAGTMTGLQAGLVLDGIEDLERDAASRRRAARRSHEGLHGLPGLPSQAWPDEGAVWSCYPLAVANRSGFLDYAMRAGRDLASTTLHNCARLPCFAAWATDCPTAAGLQQQLVQLPTWPGYDDAEIDATITTVRGWYEGRA